MGGAGHPGPCHLHFQMLPTLHTAPVPAPLGRTHQLTPMMVPLSTQACTGSGERKAQGMSDRNTPAGDPQPGRSTGLGLPPPPSSPSLHPRKALWVLLPMWPH